MHKWEDVLGSPEVAFKMDPKRFHNRSLGRRIGRSHALGADGALVWTSWLARGGR